MYLNLPPVKLIFRHFISANKSEKNAYNKQYNCAAFWISKINHS